MANISKIKLPSGTTYDINALQFNGQDSSYYLDFENLENVPEIVELQTELTSIGTASTFDSTSDTQLPTSLAVKNFVEGKGYTTNTGTVTSVRVQAGTGLSSSQSTAQTGTLNTTISIASGYKLPTTTEWNNVNKTIYRHSIYAKNSNDDHFNFSVDTSSSTQLWDGSDWNVPDGYYAAISDEYGIGVIKASSNSLTFYDYSGNTQSVDGSSDYQETTSAI